MLNETRKLISHSAVYGIGNVLTKAVVFFLIPLYARKLQPQEYGIVGLLELVELFGKAILIFGLGQALLRFINEYKSRHAEHVLVSSFLTFLLLANFLVLGILFFIPAPFVRQILVLTPDNVLYFRYILIVIFSTIFQGIFLVILQAEEKTVWYALYTFTNFLLLVLLNIYKVGLRNEGILGIVQSKLYVSLLGLVIVSVFFVKRFKFNFSFTVLKEGLRYGFPLVFVATSLTVLTIADRYFLKIFRGMEEVGIYSMTYKFGMILNMVLITPFRTAFLPFIFRQSNRPDVKKMFRKYLTYFMYVGFILFLGLSLFAREIQLFVTTTEYLSGYILIPVITFSYFLFGIRMMFTAALGITKKTQVVAYSAVTGALLNILLNILLIPSYGMMGAAIATLLSYLFITGTTYIAAQHWYPINWDWVRNFKLCIIGLGIFFLSLLLNFQNIWLSLLWKLVLFISFPVILYIFKFYKEEELEIFMNFYRKIKF